MLEKALFLSSSRRFCSVPYARGPSVLLPVERKCVHGKSEPGTTRYLSVKALLEQAREA